MEGAKPQHARDSNLRVVINFTKYKVFNQFAPDRKEDQLVPSCNAQQTVAKQEN